MTPRLVSCYAIPRSGGEYWRRLARVLEHTASIHCAGWDRRVEQYTPPPMIQCFSRDSHIDNANKHAYWCQAVEDAPDGMPMLLMDADTMIVRSLDDIWARPFELAYTIRPAGARFPLNAGVVFLRVSDPVRRFMQRWRDGTYAMLRFRPVPTRSVRRVDQVDDGVQREHLKLRHHYGGIAQAAFGKLLQNPQLELLALPCEEWNCEDSVWASFNPACTRILHIKSALRKAVFDRLNRPGMDAGLRQPVAYWRRCEQHALQAAERTA